MLLSKQGQNRVARSVFIQMRPNCARSSVEAESRPWHYTRAHLVETLTQRAQLANFFTKPLRDP